MQGKGEGHVWKMLRRKIRRRMAEVCSDRVRMPFTGGIIIDRWKGEMAECRGCLGRDCGGTEDAYFYKIIRRKNKKVQLSQRYGEV